VAIHPLFPNSYEKEMIEMSAIWDAFVAFNSNAAAYLYYTLSNNFWYLLIGASVVTCNVLYLKEEIVVTVREEQQAI
jgi:hypothetical protein